MADYDGLTPGQVLADASVADFIKSLGLGIAEAQRALDTNSVEQLDAFITPIDGLGGRTLFEMGLQPAFYHYQHADLSCSLQLSLKVEKEFGLDFGINGNFSDAGTSEDSSERAQSSTESGSSTRTSQREAKIEVSHSSRGALSVAGDNFQLEGNSPRDRIASLANRLRSRGDISRAIPVERCTPLDPPPTTNAPEDKVTTTPNSVTFIGGGFDNGIIRIRENPSAANSPETYQMNGSTSVDVTRSNSVENYAEKVKDAINATAFTAIHVPPGTPTTRILFDVDDDDVKSEYNAAIRNRARFTRATRVPVKLNGYASTTASNAYNRDLSERRVQAVRARLIENGCPPDLITTNSFGEDEWRAQGFPDETEHGPHRVVHMLFDSPDHFIWVDGDVSNPLANVEPNRIGAADSGGNGWIFLYNALGMSDVNGKTATIKGQTFTLSGTAVASHPADSPEAFALNLANAVNANQAARVAASASGNVTHLCNEGDKYELILLTESSSNISMSGSEGITVTQQFSRTRSERQTQERTGNRTVAVGASLDIHYSRKFEMNVTGNSAISARLVSVPAPPQFLETIRDFLAEREG